LAHQAELAKSTPTRILALANVPVFSCGRQSESQASDKPVCCNTLLGSLLEHEPYSVGRLLAIATMLANGLDEPVKNSWPLALTSSSQVFSDALSI
jgi:hypothetical protein